MRACVRACVRERERGGEGERERDGESYVGRGKGIKVTHGTHSGTEGGERRRRGRDVDTGMREGGKDGTERRTEV